MNAYQVIVFEDLAPMARGRSRGMRKSILDVAWTQFIQMTVAKAEEARGVTQAKLSRLADIGTTTAIELFEGNRDPRIQTLAKVARALGVKLADLYEETDGENTEALRPAA